MITAITGGKGGTGKSTVAVALARELSKTKRVLLVDADVDCPNDHLLLGIGLLSLRTVEQRIPLISDSCTRCGACGRVCKTKAMVAVKGREPILSASQCFGCGACKIVCKESAISWGRKKIGELYTANAGNLRLISGSLQPGEPMSERLVESLLESINRENFDEIIIDTAAGTHCPVIAALRFSDRVIAVTEPTPLGAHDLEMIMRLLLKIGKDAKIVINRSDIGDSNLIRELSSEYNMQITLEIPFSMELVTAYSKGEPAKIAGIGGLV
jgi:MinD superfamily P-loop ATPase